MPNAGEWARKYGDRFNHLAPEDYSKFDAAVLPTRPPVPLAYRICRLLGIVGLTHRGVFQVTITLGTTPD